LQLISARQNYKKQGRDANNSINTTPGAVLVGQALIAILNIYICATYGRRWS